MSINTLEELANIISKSKNKKLKEYFNLHLQEYKELLYNYVLVLSILDGLGFGVEEEFKFNNEFVVRKNNG